ncbi:MAG: sugar ABC transporter substrate-binding protein [Oscillospiraceae bacterium]|nr:sugar ABC transporter substrate-binding protein [Oscillospiraceae bacterium]MBQ7130888.1 sugar ABC transporter substrate-binding protein [Oscillospiraceae bacterium]
MKRPMGKYALVLLLLAACLYLAGCAADQETVLTVGVYSGSYWNTPNGNCYQILDEAVALFEQTHPGVKVTYVSGIPAGDYSEWLAGQILLGTEPDVYFVLPEDFELLVSSGALAQLDERIAGDSGFDTGIYYGPCLRSGQSEGKQYALPHESVPTIMFVNKTLLEVSGIPMPDNDWTWEDFYGICERVTNVDKRQYGVYGYSWQDAMYSNGASLFSEDGRSCYLSQEKVLEAIQFARRLNDLNGGYNVTARDFDVGRVAFCPLLYSEYRAYQPYPWRVKKYSAFQWDCVSMPAGASGTNISQLHTTMLGISSRTRHEELAWEFCKLLSADEELQRRLYTQSHGISPLIAVAEDPELLLQIHHDIPEGSGFSPDMIHQIMSNAVVAPKFGAYSQAMIMVESAIQESADSQLGQSGMLIAESEINLFLNKS